MEEKKLGSEADLEVAQLNINSSINKGSYFRKYLVIISCVLLIGLLAIYFIMINFYGSSTISSGSDNISLSGGDQRVKISKDSNQLISKKINGKEINPFIQSFILNVQSGSFNDAFSIYEKILILTENHPIFTGEDYLDGSKIDNINHIDQKLIQTKDKIEKSKLFLEKGIAEYDIGNSLYYENKSKYRLAVIFYYIKAILSFDLSIENSANALAHRYKGVVLLDIGTLDQLAIQELQKAIGLDKTDVIAYYKLGNAQRGIGYYRSAIDTYLLGLSVDPDYELIQNNLGITYFDLGNRDEGFKTLSGLLLTCKKYCNFANFNFANQLANETIKDNVKILIHINKAIEESKIKNEVYRDAYDLKGRLLYIPLENDPSNSNYQSALREAVKLFILALNDSDDKQLDVNMLNQNTNEEQTFYYIVKIYDQLGDKDSMLYYLSLGLDKFPNSKKLNKFLENF